MDSLSSDFGMPSHSIRPDQVRHSSSRLTFPVSSGDARLRSVAIIKIKRRAGVPKNKSTLAICAYNADGMFETRQSRTIGLQPSEANNVRSP